MIGRGPAITYLADYVNGYGFTGDDLEGERLPVVRIQHLLDPSVPMDYTDRSVPNVAIESGDLVFSWSATLATRMWDRGPALLNQHLFRVDPRQGVDRHWLKYVLDAACETLEGHMHGSAMTHITRDMMRRVRVVLPPLEKQRAIADYLDTETARIDALTTKKRRMIELLDERFRGRIEAAYAPWDRVPLKRLVAWREGPGIMAEDFRDSGVPLIRVRGVGGETVSLEGCNYLDPSQVAARWAHFRLLPSDYVISASASMGIVSQVDEVAAGAVPYTGLIIIRPRGSTSMEFVRWFLQSDEFIRQVDQLKTGTAIQHYGPTHLDQISAPAPPNSAQEHLGMELLRARRQTDKLRSLLEQQLATLSEHRRALITAAVTGELEIPAAA